MPSHTTRVQRQSALWKSNPNIPAADSVCASTWEGPSYNLYVHVNLAISVSVLKKPKESWTWKRLMTTQLKTLPFKLGKALLCSFSSYLKAFTRCGPVKARSHGAPPPRASTAVTSNGRGTGGVNKIFEITVYRCLTQERSTQP